MRLQDRIWNRACAPDFKPSLEGDRALHSVLTLHSLVMNGGLAHALGVDREMAPRAAAGFRLFFADEVARTVDRAYEIVVALPADEEGGIDTLDLTDEDAAQLDELSARYEALITSDDEVVRLFESYWEAHPGEFASASLPIR